MSPEPPEPKPCRWCGALFAHALKQHEEHCELRKPEKSPDDDYAYALGGY